MCEFKYCCGSGKCFLNEASPCSGKADKDDPNQSRRLRGVRMTYPGFLDYDELMDVLELADRREGALGDGLASVAPKFLRQARKAIQSSKRKVA